MQLDNPFVVGKYVSPAYFCDREQETATLIKHLTNGRNVALISPRRMGKSGLIEHIHLHSRTCTTIIHSSLIFTALGRLPSLSTFLAKVSISNSSRCPPNGVNVSFKWCGRCWSV